MEEAKVVTVTPEEDGTIYGIRNRFEGNLRLLATGDDYITDITIDLLSSETNRNNWRYENLAEHVNLFLRKPVLVAYVRNGKKVGDGHNFEMKVDPETGKEYADFTDKDAERMVGVIAFDEGDVYLEKRGDIDWIVSRGVIYSWYAHQLTKKLRRQGVSMPISIETLVTKMHMDGDTEVFDDYIILGVTILGDDVTPAVRGANIKTLSELDDEVESMKLRVASYRNNEPQKNEATKGVKKLMPNKKQMDKIAEKFPGYTLLGASADGMTVCLHSAEDRCVYSYKFLAEDDGTVVESRITPVALSTVAKIDDECEMDIDLLSINEASLAQLAAAQTALEASAKENAQLKERIAAMEQAERNRRINAVKKAVEAKVNQINAAMDEQVDEADVQAIVDCAAEYVDMVDANGEWVGEEKACAALMARHMEKVIAVKAHKKENNFAWDVAKKNNAANNDGIEGALARINK